MHATAESRTATFDCIGSLCANPYATYGATENAGVENAIRAKLQGWKMQEWKKQE